MAGRIDSAKRVINGTFGEMWSDGRKVAETTAMQAKIAKNKTPLPCAESLWRIPRRSAARGRAL